MESNTITLESKPLSDIVAVSTPKHIDVGQLVYDCASVKSAIGRKFQGRKGKQSLFGLVCDELRSMLGLSMDQSLDSDNIKSIKVAIAQFWSARAEQLLQFGEVTSASYDLPLLKLNDAANAADLHINASIKARRDAKDISENILMTSHALGSAKKRLASLAEQGSKCDPTVYRQQIKLVELGEKRLAQLQAEKEANK